jgi:hypothetical protein
MSAEQQRTGPAGQAVDRAGIVTVVSAVLDRPLGEDDMARPWSDLGVDSFLSTVLLIRLQELFTGIPDQHTEAALFRSNSPGDLAERLAELGGDQR